MLINDIFEQRKDQAEINFLLNKGVQMSAQISTTEEAAILIRQFPDQMNEVLYLLECFFILVRNHNQFLAEKTHRLNWEILLDTLHISNKLREVIEQRSSETVERFEDKSFRVNITTGSSLMLILLDFTLRWVSLGMLKTHKLEWLNELTFGFDNVIGFFFVLQIFVIPALIIALGIMRNNFISGRLVRLTKEIGLANLKFESKQSTWDYSLLVFFGFCGLYISQSLIPGTAS